MRNAPRKFSRAELLRRLSEALRGRSGKRISCAVGGATAMAAHGYRRSTRDVDVFVLERSLPALLRVLRSVGLEVFAVHEPDHYAAKVPGDPDPERRIDVLVPYAEPELSAIEFPASFKIRGTIRVFDAGLLALSKFYAWDDSRDPRHAYDLHAMFRRGMFDPRRARLMLASVDPGRVEDYDGLIRAFSAPARRPARPRPDGRIRRPE